MSSLPVIDHNGFILHGHLAIMSYLHETHSCPDHWYPADIQARAQMNAYLQWQLEHIKSGDLLFLNKAVMMKIAGTD